MLSGPRRCGVLGSPIAHSLSPAMHRAAYTRLGMDWTYDAHDVDEAGLAAFVAALDDGWRGLSLTMPLKRTIVPLLDGLAPVARDLGVVNTVLIDDDGLHGDNTDVPGAAAALAEAGVEGVRSARFVGGGATALSVLHALVPLGLRSLELLVRDPARAAEVVGHAERAGVAVRMRSLDEAGQERVDLLVSTVPVRAVADAADALVGAAGVVLDAVYDPWPPDLTAAARRAAVPTVSGLDLLAHQAALQVRHMTGGEVPAATLRDAAVDALAARGGTVSRDAS